MEPLPDEENLEHTWLNFQCLLLKVASKMAFLPFPTIVSLTPRPALSVQQNFVIIEMLRICTFKQSSP